MQKGRVHRSTSLGNWQSRAMLRGRFGYFLRLFASPTSESTTRLEAISRSSRQIQDNALVRTCDLEWSYENGPTRMMPLSSVPTVRITARAWQEAQRRLSAQERALPHMSFALDSAYFLESDPVRAIIMACAASETALRYYPANVASLRDAADLVASRGGNIPRLREFMKAARGGDLFFDHYGKGEDELLNRQREYINLLPTWRNKLLHEGKNSIPADSAVDAVLAVLNAIEWLFA